MIGVSISKSFVMFLGFIISIIGISKIYNPIIAMRKWGANLLLVCVLVSFSLTKILDNFFLSQEKNTIILVTLILVLIAIIIVSYVSVLLTKHQQRKDIKKIFIRILNIKFIK
jgi:Flp pilus assembly pilin Flp